jgi:hypothetical protein
VKNSPQKLREVFMLQQIWILQKAQQKAPSFYQIALQFFQVTGSAVDSISSALQSRLNLVELIG